MYLRISPWSRRRAQGRSWRWVGCWWWVPGWSAGWSGGGWRGRGSWPLWGLSHKDLPTWVWVPVYFYAFRTLDGQLLVPLARRWREGLSTSVMVVGGATGSLQVSLVQLLASRISHAKYFSVYWESWFSDGLMVISAKCFADMQRQKTGVWYFSPGFTADRS